MDWKTNKNHLPVEFKGSLIYQFFGWPNKEMYGKFEGFPPKWCIVWVPGWLVSWNFMTFWIFDEGFGFHESYPPLKLTANAPKMDKKNQKESFISQPPICGGRTLSFREGKSTSHLFQVDKASRGLRRCWLCQEVGTLAIFFPFKLLLFDPWKTNIAGWNTHFQYRTSSNKSIFFWLC